MEENIFQNSTNIFSTKTSDVLNSCENATCNKIKLKLKKFNPHYSIVSKDFIDNLYNEDKKVINKAVSFFRKKLKK